MQASADREFTSPILRTKLHPPRVDSRVVKRRRLYRLLEEGLAVPITLVSAPAGYGKSTLVADWLTTKEVSAAWLSLDQSDSDLSVFLRYSLEAVATVVPGACPECRAILKFQDLPPVTIIAGVLVNELDALPDSLVLVVDDYHLIHDAAIHDLMTEVVRHPPRPFHLIVLSRADPPLPLASLRAGGRLGEIRARDLEFTAEEAAELLSGSLDLHLEEDVLERLRTTTEGWAVGLHLVALSLRERRDVESILQGVGGDLVRARDFLVDEVLAKHSPELQECLLRTSILDRFCAPLCEEVCSVPDALDVPGGSGVAFLEWLERSNLFVNALDDRREWYRFHHLFRELLQRQLAGRLSDEQLADLRRRAATWLEANGLLDEALSHYLGCGDDAAAGDLIKRHRHDMMDREQWAALDRWLRRLPVDTVRSDLELQVQRAWICENRYRYDEMLDILDQIDRLLDAPGAGVPKNLVRGEVEALRAARCYFAADGRGAVAAADRALEAISGDHPSQRGFALVLHGFANQMLGEFDHAVTTSLEALLDEHIRGTTLHARILIGLCFIHWMEADIERVIRFATELIAIGREFDLPESVSFARYFLGVAHFDRDDLDAAEAALVPEIAQTAPSNATNHWYSALGAALIRDARGQLESARDLAAAMAARALELQNSSLMTLTDAFEAELALRRGQLARALQWARSFRPTGQGTWWRFYIPELTWSRALITEGSAGGLQRVENLLESLHDLFTTTHNRRLLIDVLVVQAVLRARTGKADAAVSTLSRAVELAQPRDVVRPFLDHGLEISELMRRLPTSPTQRPFVDEIVGRAAVAAASPASDPIVVAADLDPLTDRELEVLSLLAERLTNKEIAARLFISPATVKRHLTNIFQKLHVNRRREAVAVATALGILTST